MTRQEISAALVAVAVLGGIIWYQATRDIGGGHVNAAPAEPVHKAEQPVSLAIGSTGTIKPLSSGPGRVMGFPTQEEFDAASKAALAHDKVGFHEASQSAIFIEPGTAALIIDSTWAGAKRVRLKDGPFAERAVWIVAEAIEQ